MIDETGFNLEYWSRFTLEEFIQEGVKDRVLGGNTDKLKAAYELIRLQRQASGVRSTDRDQGSDRTDRE